MQQKISTRVLSFAAALVLVAGIVAQAQSPRLYATTGQLRTLLNRIENQTDAFKSEVQRTFRYDSRVTNREDRIEDLITDFENATDTLRVRADGRQTLTGEVDAVFTQALRINNFVNRNTVSSRARSQWNTIRNDLNTLASYYRLSWNWNQTVNNNGDWSDSNAGTTTGVQPPTLYATTRQVQNLLARIKRQTDAFEYEVQRTFTNDGRVTNREDRIADLIADFESATNTLDVGVRGRQTLTGEVDAVFRQALRINTFASRNQLSSRAQSQWATIRNDLNTLANYYRLSWNWNEQTSPTTGNTGMNTGVVPPTLYASTAQVQSLLSRIKNQTNSFRTEVERSFTADSRINNREERIADLIADFDRATDTLDVGIRGRQALTGEVDAVFRQALRINNFAERNRLSSRAVSQWTSIRNDLDTLASYYRLSWNWNDRGLPATGNTGSWPANVNTTGQLRIEGTYRLDPTRSDNVTDILNRALGSSAGNAARNMERRLASPEMIAIDARGNTVTLATSNVPQTTFEANGPVTRETNPRGRTITTTVTLRNNSLQINQEGDQTNDFYATFQATEPNQLTVTKRLYLEGRGETVTVRSVYNRLSNQADYSAVNSGRGWTDNDNSGSNNNSSINEFYVPNGTRLTARLDTTVNTRVSQIGDRVSMTVISPSQYNGAVIEGRLIEAANSGRITGRANLSFSFDTLRYNGRTYNFAGIIESVTAANGDSVTVNNEGTVRDNNQTNRTATRAGIGAVLGAIVGAIAGGGQGAAIGAGIGAGAGAGTVLIQGRDTLELGPGTTFDITASAPSNVRSSRY